MGIVTNVDPIRLAEFIKRAEQELTDQVKIQLNYLGQECVTKVRKRGSAESWTDQTGNLRSSIGAAIVEGGNVKYCEQIKAVSSTGKNGVTAGEKALKEAAGRYRDTYALVVSAGMEYASYVENMNGKDVLASTELWARKELQGRLDDAVKNAEYRISNMKI